MAYTPIFLIGTARSGTKILRDTISTHSDIEKIGYDINFVWKRYNEYVEHDELGAEHFKPKFKKFIDKYFESKVKDKPFLIEKTVGNTLRIPFLLKTFPEAKFIILYRDGRDVVESVMRQWGVAPEGNYLFKKLLSVPVLHILPFLIKYGIDTIKIKLKLKPTKSYVWGVRHKGFEQDLENDNLLEFCSKQWLSCANSIIDHEDSIKSENKLRIQYEDLVTKPDQVFDRIAEFLNLERKDFDYSSIRPSNVGKSKNKLPEEDYLKIERMLKTTLKKLNYKV